MTWTTVAMVSATPVLQRSCKTTQVGSVGTVDAALRSRLRAAAHAAAAHAATEPAPTRAESFSFSGRKDDIRAVQIAPEEVRADSESDPNRASVPAVRRPACASMLTTPALALGLVMLCGSSNAQHLEPPGVLGS
jgi:hypothetical protein